MPTWDSDLQRTRFRTGLQTWGTVPSDGAIQLMSNLWIGGIRKETSLTGQQSYGKLGRLHNEKKNLFIKSARKVTEFVHIPTSPQVATARWGYRFSCKIQRELSHKVYSEQGELKCATFSDSSAWTVSGPEIRVIASYWKGTVDYTRTQK